MEAGFADAGIHFDGGSAPVIGTYIGTTNSTQFNFTTNPFSINVWLKPYSRDGFIMGNNTVSNNGWFLSLDNDQVHIGVDTPGAETAVYTSNTIDGWPGSQTNGNYNMVTVTWDATNTPLIYINGISYLTLGAFTTPASSSTALIFGVGTNSFNTNINGLINYDGNMWLPQIWSTALSSQEIANLYLNQRSGVPWP